MDRPIGACRQALDKRFASLWRTHRDNDDFPAAHVPQSNRFGQSSPVEGIHNVGHALPDNRVCFGVEPYLGDFGDLFDADDQPHLGNLHIGRG